MKLYCPLKLQSSLRRWTRWQTQNRLLQWSLMDTDCWGQFTFRPSMDRDSKQSEQWREGGGRKERKCVLIAAIHPSCTPVRFGFLKIFTQANSNYFGLNIKNNDFVIYSIRRGIDFSYSLSFFSIKRRIKTFGCAHIQTLMDLEGPIYSEVWVLSAGA